MLGIHGIQFDSVTSSEIVNNLSKYQTFVQYWEDTDLQGQRVNTQSYQKSVIDSNTQLIGTLTNPQNKLLIESYQQNSKSINEKNSFIEEARNVLALISRYATEINQKITLLNSNSCSVSKSPLIDESIFKEPISKNVTICKAEITKLEDDNNGIALQFQKQGINQDISSLLNKVTEYQKSIDQASAKLAEINQKTSEYQEYVQKRGELALRYKDYLKSQKRKYRQCISKT